VRSSTHRRAGLISRLRVAGPSDGRVRKRVSPKRASIEIGTALILAAVIAVVIFVVASLALRGGAVCHCKLFVSQSGAGSESGRSCATAHPLSWLEDSGNWGSGDGGVSAGTTVDLCGTFTGVITFAGSGKSGDLITLRFQRSAQIRMPACPESGCIDTAGHSYLNIEGAGESAHGVIDNTEQETGKKHEPTRGIEALNCEGCTIRYMTIENLYVKTAEGDEAAPGEEIRGIEFSGNNLTIAHNTLHDIGWALYSEWNKEDKDVHLENNAIYHIDHGFASTAAFTGGSIGPIWFQHNHVYSFKNWDTPGDAYHHDGVHCYSSASQHYLPHYNGLYIGDNRFGENGKNMTGFVFIEGEAEGTPCGDSTSNIWIFNNVMVESEHTANGSLAIYGTNPHVYNNTVIGPNNTEPYPCVLIGEQASEARYENNIITTCNEMVEKESSASLASGGLNYNLYANGGENSFICDGDFEVFAAFAKWKRCTRQDVHSRARASARIVMSGRRAGELQAGSPAKRTGVNLTKLCAGPTEALCENIDGKARPRTGAWNVGAY